MSHILKSLGLSKEAVQRMSNGFRGNSQLEKKFDVKFDDKNYLYAIDQRRIRRRLNKSQKFIEARFFEGYRPKTIAKMLGVSEESVRSRLRKKGAFGKKGRPGRPRNHPPHSAKEFGLNGLEDAVSHSSLVEKVSLDQPLHQ